MWNLNDKYGGKKHRETNLKYIIFSYAKSIFSESVC